MIHCPEDTKAYIFDMDGVITNTMPDHYRAWKTVMGDAGLEVSHYDIYGREGQPGIVSVTELFESNNKKIKIADAKKLLKKKEELFKKIAKIRFIPGARELIKLLYKQGKVLALVTGTSRHELKKILPVELLVMFKVIVTGSDVKHGKPHPEPYALALKKLKLKAEEAVAIENAPFGIQSARAAGLCCLALETSLPRRYLKDANVIFENIKSLRQFIK